MIRKVNEQVSVAPQIGVDDIPALKAAGFAAIINNRPDDEEPGQPSGDAIRVAAEDHGLAYTAIPVTHAGFSGAQVEAMRTALDAAGGPVLAYCRSGTRSCNLWALAEAARGEAPDELIADGAGAGYNLEGLRPLLETLAGRS